MCAVLVDGKDDGRLALRAAATAAAIVRADCGVLSVEVAAGVEAEAEADADADMGGAAAPGLPPPPPAAAAAPPPLSSSSSDDDDESLKIALKMSMAGRGGILSTFTSGTGSKRRGSPGGGRFGGA